MTFYPQKGQPVRYTYHPIAITTRDMLEKLTGLATYVEREVFGETVIHWVETEDKQLLPAQVVYPLDYLLA